MKPLKKITAFALKLKEERRRIGITQPQADRLLALGTGQIASWESARNNPSRWNEEGCLRELAAMPSKEDQIQVVGFWAPSESQGTNTTEEAP